MIEENYNLCIGDYVEIVFDYFHNYESSYHGHLERVYFSKITEITPNGDSFLYSLEGFSLNFYIDDLKKIN